MADAQTSGAMQGAAAGSSFGPWGAVIGGGIGLMTAGQGQAAADEANSRNIAAQQTANMQNDPFAATGDRAQYVPQLNQLMQGGVAGVGNDPGFQAMEKQSMGDVQRMQAASGAANGGGATSQMLSQNMADQQSYFNQQYNRLTQLSGANTNISPAMGQAPGAAATQANQTNMNMGAGFGSVVTGLGSIFGNTNPAPNNNTYNAAQSSSQVT
jgi:hypothetical protein